MRISFSTGSSHLYSKWQSAHAKALEDLGHVSEAVLIGAIRDNLGAGYPDGPRRPRAQCLAFLAWRAYAAYVLFYVTVCNCMRKNVYVNHLYLCDSMCICIPCTFLLKQLKAWLVKEPRTLPGCGPCPARMPQNGYPISPVFGGEYNPQNLCGWQNTSAFSQKEPKNLALEIPLFLTCLSQLKFGPKIVQKKKQKRSLQPKNCPPTPKKNASLLGRLRLARSRRPCWRSTEEHAQSLRQGRVKLPGVSPRDFSSKWKKITHFSPASEWGVHSNFSRVQSSQE